MQKRIFFLGIKEAYFNAWKNNELLVKRKVLFDGDFLDNDFHDRYPSYAWTSEAILGIGRDASRADGLNETLRISNETSQSFNYLLVETYRDKYVILDVQPGAVIDLKFELIGRLSCEGESEDKQRFGIAAEFQGVRKKRQYFINIRNKGVTIETPRFETTYVPCCAVDRGGFGDD